MITADSKSLLGYWCETVDRMKPGECIEVSMHDLREIGHYHYNNADFTPADRIMENIVGSAYTHSYDVRHENGSVIFMRREDTRARRYTSPDRR